MKACRYVSALAVGLIFTTISTALADDGPTKAQLDAIAAKPGTQVETTTKADGKTIRITRNEVTTILNQSADGKWSETSIDNSGHGAVMCVWMIYVEMRAEVDLCHLDGQAELRADLNEEIGRMSEFAVANSLFPTTRERLDAGATAQLELMRTRVEKVPEAQRRNRCESGDGRKLITAFGSKSHADRTKSIDELLSVPRPAATNPCL